MGVGIRTYSRDSIAIMSNVKAQMSSDKIQMTNEIQNINDKYKNI